MAEQSLEGRRIGPYQLASRIGAGGMGEVYKAIDTRLDRTVAVKVLPAHVASDPQARERFDREGRAIAALNHPHICALYDVGEATLPGDRSSASSHEPPVTVQFLVMELLEGETLAARLTRGPLPLAETLDYAVQIASALDKAHRAGIVHRDLKPGNIFLVPGNGATPTLAAKLLDFGLAKTATPNVGRRAHGHTDCTGSDDARHDSGHGAIHVAGAGRRKRDRRTQRHLCVRHGPLRDAHRTKGVRSRQSGLADGGDPRP